MFDTTLVTIACSRDRAIQELQSYSIDKFIKDPCEHIIVIEDNKISYDEWYAMLSPYYTKHKLILLKTLLSKDTYANDSVIKNGWHRSIFLKLLVANTVTTSRYLVLDSKNFFINSVILDEWPCNEGNHLVEQLHLNRKLSNGRSWPEFFQFADKHNIPITDNAYSTTTPFMFNTTIVREILTLDDLYPLFFNREGWASEFFLYSIYTQNQGNQLVNGPAVNVTFWNTERKLNNKTLTDIYSWPNLKSIGLHRDIIAHNTDLTELYNFLDSINFDSDVVVKCLTQYRKDLNEQR